MDFSAAFRRWKISMKVRVSSIIAVLRKYNSSKYYSYKYKVAAIAVVLVIGVVVFRSSYAVWQRKNAVPDFSLIGNTSERKSAFYDYLLPRINQRNREILELREELSGLRENMESLSGREQRKVSNLAERYEVENFSHAESSDWDLLLRRIDIVPPSLALAQAANESAWGTSRFALEGKNFFGHWCFEKGCGLVPQQRPDGENYEVADFRSVQESVNRYIFNLNHHPAYRELRVIRENLREKNGTLAGQELANGLGNYSTRGKEYVDIIQSMIRYNELARFDS